MSERLDCLIVRQPYASLVAFGCKRWEFRSYECRKRGRIGIAASHKYPLPTMNEDMNRVSNLFPRGVVLATAQIVDSYFVTNEDLKAHLSDTTHVMLHGHELTTLKEPIGEPIEDTTRAIENPQWSAYAWRLAKVQPLKKFVRIERPHRSTWVFVQI